MSKLPSFTSSNNSECFICGDEVTYTSAGNPDADTPDKSFIIIDSSHYRRTMAKSKIVGKVVLKGEVK